MPTAEELTVALRSEGASETQSDLQGVQDQFQETTNTTESAADEMSRFSTEFSGAMQAAVAGLAVAATGLLSQVPVVGELFAALAAVVEAVAIQMDEVLRPVLSPLADAFYNFAGAIFENELLGTLTGIVGALGSLAAIAAAVITGIAKAGAVIGTFASTSAGVVSILGTIGSAIAGVAAAIASLPAVVIAAIGVLVAALAAYALNIGGFRDKVNQFAADIWTFLKSGFSDLGESLMEWGRGIASDAYEWGRDLIENMIDGIQSGIGRLRDLLPDLSGVDFDISNGGGVTSGRAAEASTFTSRSNSSVFNIDGRRLDERTGRFGRSSTSRRGV
jgi:phage-related minor tail protein